jgi:hypothetical protein
VKFEHNFFGHPEAESEQLPPPRTVSDEHRQLMDLTSGTVDESELEAEFAQLEEQLLEEQLLELHSEQQQPGEGSAALEVPRANTSPL